MKKLLLAALFALPLAAAAPQKADAFCFGLKGCFNVKVNVCASGWVCPYFGNGCCNPCGGGYGGGGCPGCLPGPWYQYWPYDGRSQLAGGYAGCWTLENHFVAAAPTGYPNPPNPMYISCQRPPAPTAFPYWPSQAYGHAGAYGAGTGYAAPAVFQPVSYYPSYWYGR